MKKILVFLVVISSIAFANMNDTNATKSKVIDIRAPKDQAKTGVVDGSIIITFAQNDGSVNPNFLNQIKDANVTGNDGIILIYEDEGNSNNAKKLLQQNGFKNVSVKKATDINSTKSKM